jgi:hypothetical protein
MTEDKKITSLEELDKKMREQKERMARKKEEAPKQPIVPPETAPFTQKMEQTFRENIQKSIKCMACNYQNFGSLIVMMNFIDVMKEHLPIPTLICGQCGTLFVPKWARRVINQAIAQENKILKQVQGGIQESGVE